MEGGIRCLMSHGRVVALLRYPACASRSHSALRLCARGDPALHLGPIWYTPREPAPIWCVPAWLRSTDAVYLQDIVDYQPKLVCWYVDSHLSLPPSHLTLHRLSFPCGRRDFATNSSSRNIHDPPLTFCTRLHHQRHAL